MDFHEATVNCRKRVGNQKNMPDQRPMKAVPARRRYGRKPPWSPHQAWPLVVEGPARDEELHGDRVIARAEAVLPVQRMRRLDRGAVDLDPEAGPVGHRDSTRAD